ncbi:hypothetical protein HK099_001841 [Clydaea vesicula]|uniref:VWFA domain-containing protein n=1 Tax=Clydaea vesicula TaxID=447962 RepID=A0AAD5Y1N6_9FUNG|nr:hypothetical protein HK099_001841 [Clydaea vesicula]
MSYQPPSGPPPPLYNANQQYQPPNQQYQQATQQNQMPNLQYQAPGGMQGSVPPTKYIKINGITKLNPDYTNWQKSNGKQQTSLQNSQTALPVVSTMEDYMAYNSIQNGQERPLSESTDRIMEKMQTPGLSEHLGLGSDELVDSVMNIFAKYEIPMGLISKIFELERFEILEFIIDDSGSMLCSTDAFLPNGKPMTRWQEAISRLKSMLEILAYIPTQLIQIKFLNRREVISVRHNSGQPPQSFISETYAAIDMIAAKSPSGTTPAFAAFQESFSSGAGKKVARYFFGDGEPNSGEKPRIENLVRNRLNPQDNPITFLSCTNEDAAVLWMKELEEVAPYVAEFDDFADESREVLKDQGQALPFTKGFHLIGQLIAVLNPRDLDAMDESIPFTKYILDQLLGIQQSNEDYRHYFNLFCQSQSMQQDPIKKNMNWNSYYNNFLNERYSDSFPFVIQFRQKLGQPVSQFSSSQSSPYNTGTQYGAPASQYGQSSSSPYAAPSGQYASPSSQYAPPTGQYAPPTGQYVPTTGQYAPPTGQYVPPTGQYAPPTGQYAPPTGQYAPPTGQYAPPTGQYAPPTGQYAPPTTQYGQPQGYGSGQYQKPSKPY